jgi:hypothetical protein
MTNFDWLKGLSTNPVIGARAFAAAGALTAARWKPSDGDYGDALASIVKDGSGLISWQHPSSSDVISAIAVGEADLAEAWNRAFAGGASGANPFARIMVDTRSFAKAGAKLQDRLIDTYRKLISPWMGRLDDNQPGQIAALSFTAFESASSHDWNWPIRVGLPVQPSHAMAQKLNSARGVRRDFMSVVSSQTAEADVVLLADPPANALATTDQLPSGLTILYGPNSRFDAARDLAGYISNKASSPTALIDVSERSIPKFMNEFADEIAHNKPLDVALFDAYRNIFNAKGNRSRDISPLVLLAPRRNAQAAFGSIQLENRVKELANRLDQLPGGAIVGSPSGTAKYLGIEKSARTVGDYRSAISQAIENRTLNFEREIYGSKALRSATRAIEGLEAELSSDTSGEPGSDFRADAGPTPSVEDSVTRQSLPAADQKPFSAFPRLDAPATVDAGKNFEIELGFSDVPDPSLPDQLQKITIADAREDEKMLVIVAAENGQIIAPNHARLKLKLDAAAKFTVRPAANCDFVRISAEYLFRDEPVGFIVRTVPVAGRPSPEPDHPAIPDLFWPILKTVDRKTLDLVLLVKRETAERITWQAVKGDEPSAQIPVDVGDAKQFASQLDRDQRQSGYQGFESHNAVQVIGQTIALNIPQQIQEEFLTPCFKAFKASRSKISETPQAEKSVAPLSKEPETPRILILTNEPYIPWELALLDPSVTGEQDLQYFGALARIGRWWVAPRMTAPMPSLKVEKISVVCADAYEVKTNKRQLPEAKAEKEWLNKNFDAIPVQGKYPPVIDWIKSLPIGPGHLAHFALHGYSNPIANEQVLVLGDGGNVTPALLSGLRLTNKEPRYGMVFLNACQVGTAGVTLGQFAGFPGSLLAAGTNAVIGPIWEVNDVAAHHLVESFYKDTFNQHVPVSEALRKLRANCDPKATTTPLAYIFYGHPDLMLQR